MACHCNNPDPNVVALLLQHYPEAIRVTNQFQFQLQYRNDFFLQVLRILMPVWPDVIRRKKYWKMFCINDILSHAQVSLSDIKLLVEIWPKFPKLQMKRGRLPLHLICWNRYVSYDVICYLIDLYPYAVQVHDSDMQLPLHWACQARLDTESIKETINCLVQAWPESVHMVVDQCKYDYWWHNYNAETDQDNDIVDGVADGHTHDDDRKSKDNQCLLPLDLMSYPNPDETDPDETELSIANFLPFLTNGIPPFHFACMHPCTTWYPYRMRTLTKLNETLPAEEWAQFYKGMLPFHYACHSGAPKSILQWCVEKYADAAHMFTIDTRDTPLHCYLSSWSSNKTAFINATTITSTTSHRIQAKHKLSLSAVQFLIEQHMPSLSSPNKQGFLPLHVAAMCDVPLDILFYLACEYPESLLGTR